MAKKKEYGECRICGETKQLTEEHYIPRAAGGGEKITLYKGDELVKMFQKDKDGNDYQPYGNIKQSGLSAYTLCKECNELSGVYYDQEFARFYKGIHSLLASSVKIPEGENLSDYLEGKVATISFLKIKPLNIAKRILVSFCSVEYPGLTERIPEIRKAILEKDYNPNTDDIAIYMSLHLGNSAFYGTVAALKTIDGKFVSQAYAGIESEFIGLHFSSDPETILRGLDHCLDITSWLSEYEYDQEVELSLELIFNKSLMIRFPLSN